MVWRPIRTLCYSLPAQTPHVSTLKDLVHSGLVALKLRSNWGMGRPNDRMSASKDWS